MLSAIPITEKVSDPQLITEITENMTIPILTNKESTGTNEMKTSKPSQTAEVTEDERTEIKPNPRFEEIPNDKVESQDTLVIKKEIIQEAESTPDIEKFLKKMKEKGKKP